MGSTVGRTVAKQQHVPYRHPKDLSDAHSTHKELCPSLGVREGSMGTRQTDVSTDYSSSTVPASGVWALGLETGAVFKRQWLRAKDLGVRRPEFEPDRCFLAVCLCASGLTSLSLRFLIFPMGMLKVSIS